MVSKHTWNWKRRIRINITILINIAGERNLINNPASAQNSVLSGTTTSTVYAYQNLTLNVQAKDDFGNNITTGGDKFVIEIKNEWTVTS